MKTTWKEIAEKMAEVLEKVTSVEHHFCNASHHDKLDYHSLTFDNCPVWKRAKAALADFTKHQRAMERQRKPQRKRAKTIIYN